jgi:hypothetical protein
MKRSILFFFLSITLAASSQIPDHVYKSSIRSIRLHKANDPYSYPIISLNSTDRLELHFDDTDANVKSYYYSFQLCNADWSPNTELRPFDYLRGFLSNRIATYRNSSIAFVKYTNYYVRLPDRNCAPTRSGNYLLKVFLDSDTSKVVLQKDCLF